MLFWATGDATAIIGVLTSLVPGSTTAVGVLIVVVVDVVIVVVVLVVVVVVESRRRSHTRNNYSDFNGAAVFTFEFYFSSVNDAREIIQLLFYVPAYAL